jgi:esterase/lipase superfamily enzyme
MIADKTSEKLLCAILILALVISGCSKKKENTDPVPEYVIEIADIHAASLKSNLIKADTLQHAYIMLPPFYKLENNTHYPVVYFIHGYDKDYRSDYGIFRLAFNEMAAGTIKKFIIVSLNSSGPLGGTFGVNSPVNGNWEDHITKEVIAYVDGNYRTMAAKESRAISGFSMGGFAALNLGLRHPELYNLVYAISPGVMKTEDMKSAFDIWQSEGGNFLNAYGSAFSPDLKLGYPYAGKPLFNGMADDNVVVENWENGFANFDKKINTYLAGSVRLKKIALDYGLHERYAWIPAGCTYLATILNQNSIPFEEHHSTIGAHDVYPDQVKTFMLPFFSENLNF